LNCRQPNHGPHKSTTIFNRRTREIIHLSLADRTFRQLDRSYLPTDWHLVEKSGRLPLPRSFDQNGNGLAALSAHSLLASNRRSGIVVGRTGG
jgi:hypothetical protein